MDEIEINERVAKNLQSLRKARHLTQQEFAETLGYSDKNISKWELGKAVPSAEILLQIADFYGVSVDSILRGPIELKPTNKEEDKKKNKNKIAIACLTGSVILLVATCIFVNGVISVQTFNYWIAFLWTIPAIGLLDGILVKRFWGKGLAETILFSIFIWGLLLSFSITFYLFLDQNIFFILFVGIPLQASLLLYETIKK